MNPSVPTESVRAIDRAFDVLEALAASDSPLGMSDIAEHTGLPRPTVHRVLHTLASSGYVYQLANHRYGLGTRMIWLAKRAANGLGPSMRPLLAWAVEATRESASVAILDGDEARYIAHAASDQAVRVFQQVGNCASLHSTGVGKAILSAMPDDEVRAIIGRTTLVALTPNTITDPDQLFADIQRARERGYASDLAEHEAGVSCVAEPVPGPLPLAVSISGPESRMTGDFSEATCLPVLRSLAVSLSETCAQFQNAL